MIVSLCRSSPVWHAFHHTPHAARTMQATVLPRPQLIEERNQPHGVGHEPVISRSTQMSALRMSVGAATAASGPFIVSCGDDDSCACSTIWQSTLSFLLHCAAATAPTASAPGDAALLQGGWPSKERFCSAA